MFESASNSKSLGNPRPRAAMILLALFHAIAGAAGAAQGTTLSFDAGFDFYVAGEKMPAGRYTLRTYLPPVGLQLCRHGDVCRSVPQAAFSIHRTADKQEDTKAFFAQDAAGRLALSRIVLRRSPNGGLPTAAIR